MNILLKLIPIVFFLIFTSCNSNYKEVQKSGTEKNYIFFIHNKFLEDNPDGTFEPKYGVKVEYAKILESFRKDGFIVFSEKRKSKTNWIQYAEKVKLQIDSLISSGIKPNHITVVGASKGGYIAQYVSTIAKNPDLNFVFIGSFQNSDILETPEIQFCGNILTIYEKSDIFGVSAIHRKETSKLKINQFKEIELNTGLKHGFLYSASDKWIKPCKMWAKRKYDLVD